MLPERKVFDQKKISCFFSATKFASDNSETSQELLSYRAINMRMKRTLRKKERRKEIEKER
jgi:hypothetical protein